jgi:hypothetical protein
MTPMSVAVVALDTVSDAPPEDEAKLESPEYVAVTLSLPTGAFVAAHAAEPTLNGTLLQSVTAPTLNVTVPVGVPPAEVTEAE